MRVLVTAITFLTWAALLSTTFGELLAPWAATIPLLALVAGFEVAFAIHVGVERIGRYLVVRFEQGAGHLGPAWERAVGSLDTPSGGVHPLFTPLFLLAVIANLLVAVSLEASRSLEGLFSAELAAILLLHATAVARMLSAARYAAGQRSRDEEQFRAALERR